MRIVADTHLHIYPCHDLSRLSTALFTHLGASEPTLRLAFLTERYDCDLFHSWLRTEPPTVPGLAIRRGPQDASLVLEQNGARCLVFPGRQVVARERIEILALATSAAFPDRLPAAELVTRILDAGGVPVVAWAPGKWFFERGKVVQSLLDTFSPDELLLGDSSLRPTVWAEPLLMRTARRAGFKIVAGSDPLPFVGDDVMAGTYATMFDADFDEADPLSAARLLLTRTAGRSVGRRGGPIRTLIRLFRNARS